MRRYSIEEADAGFRVKMRPHPLDVPGQADWLVELAYDYCGGRRHPAHIVRGPCYLQVEGQKRPQTRLVLPDCYGLVDAIAHCLLAGWLRRPELCGDDDRDYLPSWLETWLPQRTAWAIASQVRAQWERLLAGSDPTVLAVHKAVFSANFGYGLGRSVIVQEELYREKFLVEDILTFRAARIAAGFFPLDKLTDWRALFCPPEVRPYTSLNKTLNALPGGVPPRLLFRLSKFILPRPITKRLELVTTILADGKNNFGVFAHAHADEIAEAMRRVGRFLHRELSHRRWRDVRHVVRFLYDFPERHTGRILGLADKAIRWHRDSQGEEIRKTIRELGHDTRLARPPIPLPVLPGVQFLETVGDVCNEAERMGHCIASYAKRAYLGQCYLFHVEYEGDAASVEVSPDGWVLQSQGPGDQPNRATAWAKAVLSKWGKTLRRMPTKLEPRDAQVLIQGEIQEGAAEDVEPRQLLARVLGELERETTETPVLDEADFLEQLRRMG